MTKKVVSKSGNERILSHGEKIRRGVVRSLLGMLAFAGFCGYMLRGNADPKPTRTVPEVAVNGEGMNDILLAANKGILGGSVYDQNALAVGQTIIMKEVKKVSPVDAEKGILPAGVWEAPVFKDAQ